MKILVGCETSGVFRRAFAARGHDVWSCDLLPAEDGSNRHICGDIRDHLHEGWDLAVLHPPCTRLCNSGVRWLHTPPPGRTRGDMWAELREGADLFAACWQAPISRVAVENPVMHRHARAPPHRPAVVVRRYGQKSDGLVSSGSAAFGRDQPCRAATRGHPRGPRVGAGPPRPDRWKFRSRSFPGMAEAAADQWGQQSLAP